MLLIALAALVIFTVIFPDTTTIVAQALGIGRGSDLVFYLTSFAVMFLAALVYLEFRKVDDRIAELTRDLALRDWQSEQAVRGANGAATQEASGLDDETRA